MNFQIVIHSAIALPAYNRVACQKLKSVLVVSIEFLLASGNTDIQLGMCSSTWKTADGWWRELYLCVRCRDLIYLPVVLRRLFGEDSRTGVASWYPPIPGRLPFMSVDEPEVILE